MVVPSRTCRCQSSGLVNSSTVDAWAAIRRALLYLLVVYNDGDTHTRPMWFVTSRSVVVFTCSLDVASAGCSPLDRPATPCIEPQCTNDCICSICAICVGLAKVFIPKGRTTPQSPDTKHRPPCRTSVLAAIPSASAVSSSCIQSKPCHLLRREFASCSPWVLLHD